MNSSVYIAYDNEDPSLGHFFQSCFDRVREIAIQNSLGYYSLPTQSLTKETINQHTDSAEEYVFSAFSHGTDNSMIRSCDAHAYIESNVNVKNFYSSIFYTFACCTANGIGAEFKDSWVLGYFGYNDYVWVLPKYQDMFVNCAIKGLTSYLEGRTLNECVIDMLSEYDRYIQSAIQVDFDYALLLRNKQSLVTIINNGDKTIND